MSRFSRKNLVRLSRDRGFLIRSSLVVAGISVLLSLVLSLVFSPARDRDLAAALEAWSESLEPRQAETIAERVAEIRFGHATLAGREDLDCTDLASPREEEADSMEEAAPGGAGESKAAEADAEPTIPGLEGNENLQIALETLERGIVGGEWKIGIATLETLPADLPLRNEFLGDLHFLTRDFPAALEAYRAEREMRPDSTYAKRSAVMSAWRDLDRGALRSLLADPEIREAIPPYERLDMLADARDLPGLARATIEADLTSFLFLSTIPSLFIAAVWFVILMSFWEVERDRLLASLAAFLLGIFSAVLTLFFVVVQERIQGFEFSPDAEPISQLIFFVAGVGLREEFLKLVCFLPVAWWACRRKSDIEGILLAALVGLGFAFQENILYLDSAPSTQVGWRRFLTANALHFSLTGIAGFYLFRMLRRRGRGWEEFLAVFIAVVLAHGFYNSLLSMPSLATYSPLSFILIALIAYRFFDPLRGLMDVRGTANRISPLGVFVLGSVVMTCLVLLTSSLAMPWRSAMAAFLSAVGGMIPLAFAFVSRFRDL